MSHNTGDVVLKLLAKPLWRGHDEDFASYARLAFQAPPGLRMVTVTEQEVSGHWAVLVGELSGGVVFVVAPQSPTGARAVSTYIVGPMTARHTVVTHANTSRIDDHWRAINGLLRRQLPVARVLELLPDSRP